MPQQKNHHTNVVISSNQTDYDILKLPIERAVLTTLQLHNCHPKEIQIHFVDEITISEIHHQIFNDPSTTDCITLPLANSKDLHIDLLGEIFVCPAVGIAYAKQRKQSVPKEITLYVIHGVLHLLGFDDMTQAERSLMRKEEARALSKIFIK